MVAAKNGNVEMVRQLIQQGAGVNLTDKVTVLVWWELILCCAT